MAPPLRLHDIAIGDLERDVLDALWSAGPLNPGAVHERVGAPRGISVNTVSSALKRLQEKGLLTREKVSHAYVYHASVSRTDLQRHFIEAISAQFGEPSGHGLLAAFVDLAEDRGEDTLRRLEKLIADRLDAANRRSSGAEQ
jgi:predicted transcriptional regulator